MKKLLMSLLCVAMIVCFMPTMAWAEDGVANVTDRTSLENALKNTEISVINIMNDIDMGSDAWHGVAISSGRKLVINGNGNTISNLKVYQAAKGPNGTGIAGDGGSCDYYTGWIADNHGNLTVNNLAFSHATIDANPVTTEKASTGSSILAVVCANNSGTLVFNDINVDSSVVKGYNKIGALVGATQAGSFTANHCAITNNQIILEKDGSDSEAGWASPIIGHDGSNLSTTKGIKLENNTVKTDESVVWAEIKTLDDGTQVAKSTNGNWYGLITPTYSHDGGALQNPEIVYRSVSFAAEIDGYKYESLQDAVNAVGNNAITVTLLKNVDENIVIPAGKEIVLELNGKTLSGKTTKETATITNNGTITIQDSSEDQKGRIIREDNGNSGYYVIDNQGTMTINSGNVYNSTGTLPNGSSLIRNAGNKAATLTITGGKIQQDGFIAIKNDDYGILNITGGEIKTTGDTVTNTASAVQNWSKATITGGKIEGTIWTSCWKEEYDASITKISGTPEISGQIIARQEKGYGINTKKPTVEISSGTFNETWNVADDQANVSVSGGGFASKNVKKYVGKRDVYLQNNRYYVATAPAHSAGMNTWTKGEDGIYTETYVSHSSGSATTDNVTNKPENTTAGTPATTTADINASTTTKADGTKTTTATVDNTTAGKIVDKAVANKSEEVVVDATSTAAAPAAGTTTEVALPEKTVQDLAAKTDANVTIKTDAASVALDKEAVDAVAAQAGTTGTVKLVVETVKTDADIHQVELKLVTSNGAVTDFKGGNVAVTVKLDAALSAKDVVCVYIDDNGVYHKVNGQKNADGTYTFTTGHFSTYAVMSTEEAEKVFAQQDAKAADLTKALKLQARSAKTAKGNIKVTLKVNADDIKALEDLGYTVKYKYYRSTVKAAKYTAKVEKTEKTYTNTTGKKGARYYYKARVMVYGADGQLVAKTALNQCKYACRIK